MESLYDRIELLGKQHGYENMTALCKAATVSRAVMSELKSGRTSELSIKNATKFAKCLNVSVDYLLGKTVFRTPYAAYELWGTNLPDFEAPFEFGGLLKEAREEQNISLNEMSTALGITESDLDNIEQGNLPISSGWAEKMASYLGTNVSQILFDHDLYDEEVPDEYHADVQKWESLNAAAEDEAAKDAYVHKKSSGNSPKLPSNVFPIPKMRRIPIVGTIRAGMPIFAEENIEGYEYDDVPEGEDCFFLRVKGDSMMNARICDGDLVLIKQQPCADDGQIVACLVNGDEATLKRFYRQKDMVILKPENPAYNPIVVPCADFESGYARIIGIVTEVKFKV